MNIRQKLAVIFILTIIVLGGGGYLLSFMYSKGDALFISEADREYFIEKPTIVPSVTLINSKGSSTYAEKSKYQNNILTEMKANSLTEASGIGSSNPGLYSSGSSAFAANSSKKITISSTSGGSSSGLLALGGSHGTSGSTGGSSGGSGGITGSTSGNSSPAAFVPVFGTNETSIPPSGDPDPGEMIPAGDGLWILMLLALGYMFYIRRK